MSIPSLSPQSQKQPQFAHKFRIIRHQKSKSSETIPVQAESSLTNYSGLWRQRGKWLLCEIIKGKYLSCRQLYFGEVNKIYVWGRERNRFEKLGCTITKIPKCTNTNTQIQIHKYKYTNTNTYVQIHKYKTNTNGDAVHSMKMVFLSTMKGASKGRPIICHRNCSACQWRHSFWSDMTQIHEEKYTNTKQENTNGRCRNTLQWRGRVKSQKYP